MSVYIIYVFVLRPFEGELFFGLAFLGDQRGLNETHPY